MKLKKKNVRYFRNNATHPLNTPNMQTKERYILLYCRSNERGNFQTQRELNILEFVSPTTTKN
jgi:hypothetical protein